MELSDVLCRAHSRFRSDCDYCKSDFDYGKMEPLDPHGVGVGRSHPESFGVVWSRLEWFGVGVVRSLRSHRSRPESSGVIRSRLESGGVNQSRSHSELSKVDRSRALWFNVLVIRHFISLCFFVFHIARALTSFCFEGRLRTTPDDSDSQQLRTTP